MVEMRGSVSRITVPDGSTVADVARKVGIYPDSAVFLIDEKIVPSDEGLRSGIKLTILPAASGG